MVSFSPLGSRTVSTRWSSAVTRIFKVFTPLEDGTTFVSVTNSGLTGDGDELVKQATDSTQGFSLMLAGLEALLEHDVRLNIAGDRYPSGLEEH